MSSAQKMVSRYIQLRCVVIHSSRVSDSSDSFFSQCCRHAQQMHRGARQHSCLSASYEQKGCVLVLESL
jgi:hypothetical protein